MLSRKQGRSFPTPDLSARLAPSRQPSHGRRPRLELRHGRNGGNGPHAKSTNRTDLRTALLHSQDADAGATTTTKVRSQPLKISSPQLELLTQFIGSRFSQPLSFLRKKLERMVGTYTPSIAPLEAPVSDCGMGLGGVEASTAGRNEVWRRGVVGGSTAPFQN